MPKTLDFLKTICIQFPIARMLMTMHFVGQIEKLKEDFNAGQRQNANQQIRERGVVHRRDEAPIRTPRKRQRAQSSDSEYEDSDDQPRVWVRANSGGAFSREQIRDVLGGSDRGWGSTRYVCFPLTRTSQFC